MRWNAAFATAIPLLFGGVAAAQNVAPGAWWPAADMGSGRNLYGLARLPDGRIMVAGGSTAFGEAGTERNSVEFWSPATMTWSTGAYLTAARAWHSGTLLDDGRVLVAGGNEATLASAEVWDPTLQTWSATTSMSVPRWKHTATKLADGRVLVAGGANGGTAHATAEIFDPATNTWSATANSLTTARANHRAVRLPDGRVMVVGGTDGSESAMIATAEIWSPTTNMWSGGGTMAESRSHTGLALLPDGRVLAASGGIGNSIYRDTAEIWNPATNAWTQTGRVRVGRSWPVAATLADGRVLLAGGYNHTLSGADVVSSHVKFAEVWDPATGSWHTTGSMITARDYCEALRLPDGRVLIVGGDDGNFTVNNIRAAEFFDPESGTFRPFEFAQVTNATPQLVLVSPDPQGDDIRYEIQYGTDPSFAGATTANSSGGGFTNLVNGADTDPFTQGQTVAYTTPALTAGATYWWRARFVDPAGSALFSNWTAAKSFTVPSSSATHVPYHITSTAQLDKGRATSVSTASNKLAVGNTASTTAALSPTVSFNDGWGGTGPNAFADDNVNASTAVNGAQSSYRGFGASVPAAATITGVVVSVNLFKSGSGGSNAAALDLEISLDNGATWSAAKRIDPLPNNSEATRSQGSSTDTWGLALTPANVGNLAVRMTSVRNSSSPTWNVDWLRITLHYTAPATSGSWLSPYIRNSYLSTTNARNWSSLSWTEVTPGGCTAPACDATIDVLDPAGNVIGSFSGLTMSPVSLAALDPATNPVVRLRVSFVSGGATPPEVNDLSIDTVGGTPLASRIVGLAADPASDGRIGVRWSTEGGADFSRFLVLRAAEERGELLPVGEVAAEAFDFADYSFTDAPPHAGTWWYALDAERLDGTRERVGPVAVEMMEAASPGCGCATSRGARATGSVALLALALVLLRARVRT